MNFHANLPQGKPRSRLCEPSKTHLRGKSRGYDIVIAARTTPEFSLTSVPRICQRCIARVSFGPPSFPSYASWSGHGCIAWLLPRASPLAPTYAPFHACYVISCHLTYAHTPSSSSKCRTTPSTNQLHVFAFQVGHSVWLNKEYCLNTSSSSSKCFRQGNAWNLFDSDNQSAAIFMLKIP